MNLYVGYFDEFGHNGPYVSRSDSSYKTHPVFGLGGFVLPADNIRELSGAFRYIKESGQRFSLRPHDEATHQAYSLGLTC